MATFLVESVLVLQCFQRFVPCFNLFVYNIIVDMIIDFDFLSSEAFRKSSVVELTSVFCKEWCKLLVWPCFVMYLMDLLISYFCLMMASFI